MSKPARHISNHNESPAARKSDEQSSGNKRRIFHRGGPPTTTGQLLLEVALFAAENKAFVEQSDPSAAERAREHLIQIRELVNRRLAEIPSSQDDNSNDGGLVES